MGMDAISRTDEVLLADLARAAQSGVSDEPFDYRRTGSWWRGAG